MSPNIFLDGPQKSSIFLPINMNTKTEMCQSFSIPDPLGSLILSGLTPFNIQIASITSLTPAGGLFIVFTIVIS